MEQMKKEAANETTSGIEASPLKEFYAKLKTHSENGKDCTEILQKIIDFSYENAISEAELSRHLA